MALPNYDDLKTLDKAVFGGAFIKTPAKDIDLWDLDYVWQATPFARNKYSTAAPPPPTQNAIFFGVNF
jgi:hypothetical protein